MGITPYFIIKEGGGTGKVRTLLSSGETTLIFYVIVSTLPHLKVRFSVRYLVFIEVEGADTAALVSPASFLPLPPYV